MAAGKNQPQAVILDILAIERDRLVGDTLDLLGVVVERVEAGAAANAVDGS